MIKFLINMEFENLIEEINKDILNLSEIVLVGHGHCEFKSYFDDLTIKISKLNKIYEDKKAFYHSLNDMISKIIGDDYDEPSISNDKVECNNQQLAIECNNQQSTIENTNAFKCDCTIPYVNRHNNAPIKEKFCGDIMQPLLKCDNFKMFLKINPIIERFICNKIVDDQLKNLFTPIPIVNNIITNNSVSYWHNNIATILNLVSIVRGERNKSWIAIALYDYIIRNWKMCIKFPKFRITIVKKWNTELIYESEFVKLGNEINPYFNEWNSFFLSCKENKCPTNDLLNWTSLNKTPVS
jgi:hypothetical protein